MKNDPLFTVLVISFLVALMTWAATFNITNARWETDCQKLGKTVTGGKVYDCSLKEATK